ncbi:TetR/AcrR family transcriptional regulator [Isoptericola jiangsuensis]|uniref:TetR/AcrR family transcriptional regulator n=1 Tax=Bacteria TaxID=2 RepID=UPI00190B3853|nr:TetR/AcrR family transcriptional regulator [Stenotrophomonas sp. S41]MBK0011697.1 TetR/AcrR family transcriptional regulator [Stenotrophomonas sp. S41]
MIEETRGKLIAAARRAFGTKGFAKTSMDHFTSEIGLTRGALYHHFGSKEGLLQAVVQQIEDEVAVKLDAVSSAAATSWEGLLARCHLYTRLALVPEIRQIILQDTRAVFGDVPLPNQLVGIDAIARILVQLIAEKTIRPVDPQVTARMIYGMVTEASFWIAEVDADQAQRLNEATIAMDSMLAGLKG